MLTPFTSTDSAYSFREGERCLLPVDRKRTALKEVTQEEDSEANALGGNCSSDVSASCWLANGVTNCPIATEILRVY
jgi:hypothetical protein